MIDIVLKVVGMLIVVALIVLIHLFLNYQKTEKYKSKGTEKPLPYQSRETLFSAAERSFLGVLDQVVGNSLRVFAKVRLADILKTKTGLPASVRQSAFNRISGKHLDFVICDTADLSIRFVVELDDSSHKKAARKNRDVFLEKALAAAEVPLFRIPAKQSYSLEEIKVILFSSKQNEY